MRERGGSRKSVRVNRRVSAAGRAEGVPAGVESDQRSLEQGNRHGADPPAQHHAVQKAALCCVCVEAKGWGLDLGHEGEGKQQGRRTGGTVRDAGAALR